MTREIMANRIIIVTGWHEAQSCEARTEEFRYVKAVRSMIALEAGQLQKRSAAVEAKLKTRGEADAALESSKTRPRFDLVLSAAGAPARQPWHSAIRKRPSTCITKTSSGSKIAAIVSGKLNTRPALAASGLHMSGPIWTLIERSGAQIKGLAAGEGHLIASYSGNPQRYRPADNSLASFLNAHDLAARETLAGYFLGTEATVIDCRLLMRRLHTHQFILTVPGSVSDQYLQAAWDGRATRSDDFVYYHEPGLNAIDPVLIPDERLNEIDWPKVSVITVSYNQAQYIQACLESVLQQNYPNLEYIVVDADSTDGSVELLRQYEDRLSQLIIEKDRGQSDGLNKGLNSASGDILTWINSDDMLAPGALRRGALAMLDMETDLVAGACERITSNDHEVTYRHQSALPYMQPVKLGLPEQLYWTGSWEKADYFFQPEVLFTRDCWERAGGYLKLHLYWGMDWELWIRMAMAGAIVSHVPECIGRSREHEAQKTTSDERYLYQLKNILLEYDDLLALMEPMVGDMQDSEAPQWLTKAALNPVSTIRRRAARIIPAARARAGAVKRRVAAAVRPSGGLRATATRVLPPSLYAYLRNIYRQWPWLLGAIPVVGAPIGRMAHRKRLLNDLVGKTGHYDAITVEHAALRQRFSEAFQVNASLGAHYDRLSTELEDSTSRYSILADTIHALQQKADALNVENERLSTDLEDSTNRYSIRAKANHALQQEVDALIVENERLSTELEDSTSRYSILAKANHTLQKNIEAFKSKYKNIEASKIRYDGITNSVHHGIGDFVGQVLFGSSLEEEDATVVSNLLVSGTPLADILRTIAIRNFDRHSEPTFQAIRNSLAIQSPLPDTLRERMQDYLFTVVDVGAEPLAFERHSYAPLARAFKTEVIGFDPTDMDAPRIVEPDSENDVQTRILPHFIADGKKAQFHLARMQATSSLLEPNHELARKFVLLSEALETVRTTDTTTRTLDAALAEEALQDRNIDFLKIDVQGGSHAVLAGASNTLKRTLVCQIESEFSEVYKKEKLFPEVDALMRANGFGFVDFTTLGRQRYNAMDMSEDRYFHAGRLLWADCVYVRGLDDMQNQLSEEERARIAVIMHLIYNKYDLAAHALDFVGLQYPHDKSKAS